MRRGIHKGSAIKALNALLAAPKEMMKRPAKVNKKAHTNEKLPLFNWLVLAVFTTADGARAT